MSKQKKQYDTKALFLQGLMAFGSIFQGVKPAAGDLLTNKQMKVRKAFKSACAARRQQRKLQQA